MGLMRSAKARLLPVLRRLHPLVTLRLPVGAMQVDLRDTVIGRLLFLDGDFEPDHRRLMGHLGLAGGVCVDVGANIGLHTVAMARLAGPQGAVYAFEPEAHNFALLAENVRRNGLANVTPIRGAAGSAAGEGFIAVNPHHHGDHRTITTAAATDRPVQRVTIVPLDEALANVPPGHIRLVKIDVQGWESEVLRGMRRTLNRNPDVVLFLEVFPDGLRDAGSSAAELLGLLAELGLGGWELGWRRVCPLGEPWEYELIREGGEIDILVSQNGAAVERVLCAAYGYLPPLRPTPKGAGGRA
jgi:FkbM family methyltransferase